MSTFVPLPHWQYPDSMDKKALSRIATLTLGLFTVAVIVLSQLFHVQDAHQAKAKKESKTEQKSSTSKDDDTCFTVPSTSLHSSAHVETQHDSFFLLETILDDEENDEPIIDFKKPVNTLLQALIGAIISPNAP